jgi:hypothetical protein
MQTLPYIVNTVLIDKHEHAKRYGEWQYNPYHYCMLALVERYVLWLNRQRLTGDVLAESRGKSEDKALKAAFSYTPFMPRLKIEKKPSIVLVFTSPRPHSYSLWLTDSCFEKCRAICL